MEIKKIGDEYFTFITDCKDPKACTILLRGASKEILSVSLARKCGWVKEVIPLGSVQGTRKRPGPTGSCPALQEENLAS